MPEDANPTGSVEPKWVIKKHRTSRFEIDRETGVPLLKTVNTDAVGSSKNPKLGLQSLKGGDNRGRIDEDASAFEAFKGGDQPISAASYALRSRKNNVAMPEDSNSTRSVEPKWGNKKYRTSTIECGRETDVPLLKTVNTDADGSSKKPILQKNVVATGCSKRKIANRQPLSSSQTVELNQSATVDEFMMQSKGKTLTSKPTGEKVKAVTADLGYVLIIKEVVAELELIVNSLRNKAEMGEDIEEEVLTLTNALSKLKFLMGNKK